MISNKVMKTSNYDDSGAILYKVDCDCMDNDCITTIEIAHEKEFGLTLTFFKKLRWSSHWGSLNWFQRQIKNIKAAIKILFTGWIELEESIIIQDKEHIIALIEALETGKRKILDYERINNL